MKRRRTTCLMLLALVGWLVGVPANARDLRLADRSELPVTEYPAAGELLLLWLPSGFGSRALETPVAQRLATLGLEVWQADLLEARLLPPLESSLEEVPDSDLVALIEAARATGKRVLLLASARAGILALRGARAWEVAHPQDRAGLAGAILLHPNLYLGPPEPGQEAAYHPLVAQTRLPVFILQPEQSPWRWRLAATRAELEKGGAPVYTRLLTDVRDRFYFRPDATGNEALAAQRLAEMLQGAARLLAASRGRAPPTTPPESSAPRAAAATRGLHAYRGPPAPPALALTGLDGRARRLEDFRGQVLLVNFWASWCPPCVHEMPSMQRLKEKLAGRPFAILAVNLAEPEREVRTFLANKVRVDFPVFLDRDGAALKAWKVFVFPTSFVLDGSGRIRLAVFGEVEWDRPEVLEAITALLPGQP
jgi:thiol-disulfide isomerase/thioredoxin